jgi:hypothetical protein
MGRNPNTPKMLKYLMIDVALSYYEEYSLKVLWQFWSILKQEWLPIYVFGCAGGTLGHENSCYGRDRTSAWIHS